MNTLNCLILYLFCFYCLFDKSKSNSTEESLRDPKSSAQISGVRIQYIDGVKNHLQHFHNGKSVAIANLNVNIVIFGCKLNKIDLIRFTFSEFCDNATDTEPISKSNNQIVVKHMFNRANSIYKICYAETINKSQLFFLAKDPFTFILTEENQEHYLPYPVQIIVICLLLMVSGLLSGLSLGLMTLSPQELTILSNSGTPRERMFARKILPLRKSGSHLLCSLITGNVMVNSAISILFDDLAPGYIALIYSSICIMTIGEFIPQVICVKKSLEVGARTIWLTRFIMVLTGLISYPIGRLFDHIIGEENITYNRKRLMELIKLTTDRNRSAERELKIAAGAMLLTEKTVADVMTKSNDVYMLPETTALNAQVVAEILRMGYTRIPVYSTNRNNVVSLLFVKDLILLDPEDNITVKMVCNYHMHKLRFVCKNMPLNVLLEEFKQGEYHLAIVVNTEYKSETTGQLVQISTSTVKPIELLGVVTLEDILEEILQEEIVDESDMIIDNRNKIQRRRKTPLVTIQWLITNHDAFKSNFIDEPILERLVRQNVHKLEFSHVANDPVIVYPKSSRLYMKKQPSDRFVLILEGRVFVTIGEPEMTFEAGPWHYFGKEIIDKILATIKRKKEATEKERLEEVGFHPSNNLLSNSTFVPDFFATIKDNCTYLEITADTYMLAYKSTLISKERKNAQLAKKEQMQSGNYQR